MHCEEARVGGAPRPSDGWHGGTIASAKYEIVKSQKDGKENKVVHVTLIVADGSEEDGRRAFPTLFMENQNGRAEFARLLYFSKIAPLIEKNFDITEDLPETKWGDKYANPAIPRCEKLIDNACLMLEGRTIDFYTKVEKDYCNVRWFYFFGEGEKSGVADGVKPGQAKGAAKPSRATATAAAAATSAPAEAAGGDDWGG